VAWVLGGIVTGTLTKRQPRIQQPGGQVLRRGSLEARGSLSEPERAAVYSFRTPERAEGRNRQSAKYITNVLLSVVGIEKISQ
jgi:hypothetical protein